MSIAFDASYYLLAYPDVAAAVVRGQFPNAYTHFVLHGAKELRNPNAQFNAAEYAGMNPDVANAVAAGTITNVWDHYVTFGIAENRAPSLALKDFDAASYLAIHTDVAAAVTAGTFKSAIDHYLLNGQAEGRTWGENVALTNGTDKLVANKFVAGLVYTPGGNDRINSLQDEDELTGIGTNPTLTATLGNANDNGGPVITPILKGIETVNVAFTGSNGVGGAATAVDTLDLQDSTGLTKAVNITRITTDAADVTIRNLTSVPAELSVTNTHAPATAVNFTFLASATAGTADATKLTLSNVQTTTLKVGATDNSTGVETINLVSNGAAANRVGTLDAKDLVTLNITGAQNLAIGTINDRNVGKLTTIDGSTATGNLNLTIDTDLNTDIRATNGTGKAIDFTLKTGSGNDVLNVTAVGLIGNAADAINLGSGDDTVNFVSGESTAWTDEKSSAAFAGVEAINVARIGNSAVALTDLTLDLSRFTADADKSQTITLSNGGDEDDDTASFILNNASAEQAVAIRLTHSNDTNNDLVDNAVSVNLKTASGASDTVGLTIVDGLNSQPRFNFELTAGGVTDATRVENVTITDSDTESNTVKLTHGDAALGHTGTITLKGGRAGDFLNLDWSENAQRRDDDGIAPTLGVDGKGFANTVGSNTGALIAAVINAEDYVGDVIVRVSSTPAAISAVGAQTIKMGSGNDFVIFDILNGDTRAGLTISDTVSGGAGSDTLAIGGGVAINLGASEWTNVSGFETIRLLGNGASYTLALTDQLITQNAADGKILNIVNDNDPANDAAKGGDTAGVGVLSRAIIDARALAVGLNINYNGEEGAARTTDRFLFVDRNINATAVIDGGATNNDPSVNDPANDDILEVYNAAVISTGDLANIKNVGTIQLINDLATSQNFTVQLNDTVVDAMVNSYHTSTAAESETLTIRATDNGLVTGANAVLNLEAGDLTARSNVVVIGGAGADTIVLGGGADSIYGGVGNDTISSGAGNDTIYGDAGVDTITTGAGSDSIVFIDNLATSADADMITDFTVGAGGDKIVVVVSDFAGAILSALTNNLVDIAGAADNSVIIDTANTGYADFAAAEAAVQAANAGTDDYLLAFYNTTSGYVELWADADSATVGSGVLVASFTNANDVATALTFLTGLVSSNFEFVSI